MKKLLIPSILMLVINFTVIKPAKAQDVTADPGTYMNAFSSAQMDMNKSYMAYISASAHSSRKRKIEKLRNQAVEDILTCQTNLKYLPDYKGDNSLKQASINYVALCLKVFNDDYAHIVDMDDIAERSYDEMQAYLLLQQATDDTLQVAITRINKAEETFAAKYNVNLVKNETELSSKLEESDRLSAYRNKVYLMYYKCNWEDNQLTDAVNQKNVTKIEQDRSALDKYAIEGLARLDTMHAFENDESLMTACRQALSFYKNEAETQIGGITDFYLKQENFEKLKASLDAKPADQRTQQDVDTYNKAVNDFNNGVNAFNQANNDLNDGRNNTSKTWEDTDKAFIDAHTPYYK